MKNTTPSSKPKPGAPLGNRNAANPDKFDGKLHMECHRADKGLWTAAARRSGAKNLASWVRATLNKAAEKP